MKEPTLTFLPSMPNDAEARQVVTTAMRFVGRTYRITREMTGDTIDCSTLLSQAHWLGAGIGIPFIAENQRTAVNGVEVGLHELIPGDAIFAYPSVEHSPDRLHNHVAMYLGADDNDVEWVMESRAPSGVKFSRLEDAFSDGGCRRFTLNPLQIFDQNGWLEMAAAVPKLGRLGSRLTSGSTGRRRHTGVDLYVHNSGVPVWSPIAGIANYQNGRVVVTGRQSEVVLEPVEPVDDFPRPVRRGSILGTLGRFRGSRPCNMVPGFQSLPHLHLELWSAGAESFYIQPGAPQRDAYLACNAVYAAKSGTLNLPVAATSFRVL